MILDETELKIKEDIDIIFNGGYGDMFDVEKIETLKEFSFLYNNITIEYKSVVFSYNETKFKVTDIHHLPEEFRKDHVLYHIRASEEFKSSFKSFCRDWKINKIV